MCPVGLSALFFGGFSHSQNPRSSCSLSDLLFTMKQLNFGTSLKNIPVLENKKEHRIQTIQATHIFVNKCRWAAKNALKPMGKEVKENYGFRSIEAAKKVPELVPFEKRLFELVKNIKYKDPKRPKPELQRKLAKDVACIRKETKVIVASDKTSNYYLVDKEEYKNMIEKDIQKVYKKASDNTEEVMNKKGKVIAHKLEIGNRVFATQKRPAVITLKDHKDNFPNSPETRLINPTKAELGKVSKQKLAKIIAKVKVKTKLTQWKNDLAVIDWFSSLDHKQTLRFIELDIVSFYPSISLELFSLALDWANTFEEISLEDRELFIHTKMSILVHNGTTWTKKGDVNFDVTMGSYDGAEACDLVGLFLLSKLEDLPIKVGAYRDDFLSVCSLPPFQAEKVKQRVVEVFQKYNLKVKAIANTKVANFLDITLDLNNEVHRPYIKPGTHLEYVHVHSNHPRHVTKHAVSETGKRLSLLSSNEEIFNAAKEPFVDALKRAGHKEQIVYDPNKVRRTRKRTRNRRILWFNPPFCSSMTTKLGQLFLSLLDECFPVGHVLRRTFNRHTVQLSYRTMPNLAKIIAANNTKVLSEDKRFEQQLPRNANCNCRGGTEACPMEGARCKDTNLLYGATVSEPGKPDATYAGISAPSWKIRYGNHTHSFRHSCKRGNTSLAGYIWRLKDQQRDFTIKWKTLATLPTYNPTTNSCRLCLVEKFTIMHQPELATINQHDEFYTACRHKEAKLLDKT